MTSTVTSTIVKSTTVYTYAWLDEVNASPSIQRVNGVEKRRNRATNPLNGGTLTGLASARVTLALGTDYVRATVTDASAGSLAQRVHLGSPSTHWIPVTAGVPLPMSVEVRSSTAQPMAVTAVWYDASSAVLSTTAMTTTIPSGTTVWSRYEGASTPPAGATRVMYYVGTGPSASAIGDTFDVRRVFIGDLGFYFDGSTNGSTTRTYETTEPDQVLGYESSRQSNSITHDKLGGGTDVTLRAPNLRSGTLRYFYRFEYDAIECEAIHAKLATFTLRDTDRLIVGMTYAVTGTLSVSLDDQSRDAWLVEVGYQEVTGS